MTTMRRRNPRQTSEKRSSPSMSDIHFIMLQCSEAVTELPIKVVSLYTFPHVSVVPVDRASIATGRVWVTSPCMNSTKLALTRFI